MGEHPYDVTFIKQRVPKVFYVQNAQQWDAFALSGNPNLPDGIGGPIAGSWAAWSPVNLLDANDQIRLVNKLKDKLAGSDFNMSVFLGEGHQTLRMIGDTAITLAKSIRALRKRDFAGAAAALGVKAPPKRNLRQGGVDNLSKRWLELQYGWKPLYKDVEAGAQQLAHHLNYPSVNTYRVVVKRRREYVVGRTGVSYPWTGVTKKLHRRAIIARISEPLSVPQLLGLQDPELVAWELLPFSFVADWFLPIGDWLQARALVSKLTGTFITTDKILGSKGELAFSSGVIPGGPLLGVFEQVRLTRTISTSLSVPKPNFKGLDKALSLQHCLNGIALLAQVVHGKSNGRSIAGDY